MSTRKHIAQSGQKAGQWVTCGAKQQCRNKSVHIDSRELHVARLYHQENTGEKLNLSTLPLQTVISYMASPEEQKGSLRDRLEAQDQQAQQDREKKAEEQRQKDEALHRTLQDLPAVLASQDPQQLGKAALALGGYIHQRSISETPQRLTKDDIPTLDRFGTQLGVRSKDREAFRAGVIELDTMMRSGSGPSGGSFTYLHAARRLVRLLSTGKKLERGENVEESLAVQRGEVAYLIYRGKELLKQVATEDQTKAEAQNRQAATAGKKRQKSLKTRIAQFLDKLS